ncbi:MAG: calcium/sodium antiporter [Rhodococcus sp.]|uniref:calcium/sodium antiporter n=1 Tax=Rhodococcus sp. TaxID=1831 RepID=UPI0016A555C2|nr:calcium/sodium antiporter [Rhodococcus sp. (in: high G+C Gram-positive bacteria)]NLV79116.1 calcium/sodium antiporter [Rhodococcus sp. (in: high G+C Gram-positive bacteria)]
MSPALGIAVGLVALVVGAEVLVRGGSRLATRLGLTPIVVGVTIVAVGTSAPELAIGIDAAATGNSGLALGNIVGTNIVNLLLVFGLSALMRSIAFGTQTLRVDLPAMTVAALLLWAMSADGHLGGGEALVLLVCGVLYTLLVIRAGRAEAASVRAEYRDEYTPARTQWQVGTVLVEIAMLVGGIAVVVVGADILVDAASEAARSLGVSDTVIGLTVVAIGTSAPELVTTVVATIRDERDIAIGNLLGSSVYNIVVILAVTVLATPGGMTVPDDVVRVDLPVMVAVALVCIPAFLTGRRLSRLEGALFVISYCVYLAFLLLTRT